MLSHTDIKHLDEIGISKDTINKQLENFHKGFSPIQLSKPAKINDGITSLSDKELDRLASIYGEFNGSRVRFIPASGAATRMFEELIQWKTFGVSNAFMEQFFTNLKRFPFYELLKEEFEKLDLSIEACIENKDYSQIIEVLLGINGLNYQHLPKGLVAFHSYENGIRTAFEEQIIESTSYCNSPNGVIELHFTISPEHKTLFEKAYAKIEAEFELERKAKLRVEFSVQKKSTDMIAVDMQNQIVRTPEGEILLRPGGHGALLENLNTLSHEMVFIKNIDNVVTEKQMPQIGVYKKALAGLLIETRAKVFKYLELLNQKGQNVDILAEILKFTIEELCIHPPTDLETDQPSKLAEYLIEKLDRPIRVCGMVKNTGEPGGGPFWVINADKSVSLQIVETVQIDTNDEKQNEIFNSSTHFNPVDIVCSFNNKQNIKYNLLNFTAPETGIIATKSYNGQSIRVQELPCLWNGSMANWNTIFVEVPLETFNPVKTVNDLLRESHQ